jgi:hypothetical protein
MTLRITVNNPCCHILPSVVVPNVIELSDVPDCVSLSTASSLDLLGVYHRVATIGGSHLTAAS